MRFRKRIKILPGVTLNISKSGVSTTVGVKGLSVNMNKTGTYLNTGLPGTGIYDRKKITVPTPSSNDSKRIIIAPQYPGNVANNNQ